MDRTLRISGGLYACLLLNNLQAAMLLYLPATLIKHAGQSVWLAMLLGGALTMLIGLVMAWSGSQFGRLSPVQAARQALGKPAGSLLGLLFALLLFWIFCLVLRSLQDFTVMILLQGSPVTVITGVMAAAILYAVWSGIEPMARLAFSVTLFLAGAVISLPPALLREYHILQLEPILYTPIHSVLTATMISLPWFGEIVAFFALIPYLSRPQQVYRWTLTGVGGATFCLVLVIQLCTLVMGPVLPSRMLFPTYVVLQTISLGEFFQRIEVILVVVWISSMFVKATLLLYTSSEAAAQAIGLRSHRPAAVAMAVGAVVLIQIWPGVLQMVNYGLSDQYRWAAFGMEMLLLFLFGLVAVLLRRQGGGKAHG